MSKDNLDSRASTGAPADAERRSVLLSMARGLAYVPPVVASFTMAGMSVREAHAYVTNIPA